MGSREFWVDLWAGWAGGAAATLLVQPVDTTLTRLQALRRGHPPRHPFSTAATTTVFSRNHSTSIKFTPSLIAHTIASAATASSLPHRQPPMLRRLLLLPRRRPPTFHLLRPYRHLQRLLLLPTSARTHPSKLNASMPSAINCRAWYQGLTLVHVRAQLEQLQDTFIS